MLINIWEIYYYFTVYDNTGYFILKNDILFGETAFYERIGLNPKQLDYSLSGVINTKTDINLHLIGEYLEKVQQFLGETGNLL